MGALHCNPPGFSSVPLAPGFNHNTKSHKFLHPTKQLGLLRGKLHAIETATGNSGPEAAMPQEPPLIDFAFVGSRLLPDGTPDIHYRSACGGQKLRDIMLDSNIDLYGPYEKPLLNCGGVGTCATCIVEKPKTWRLACQTVVGKQDSRGQMIIQQLPEWKAHDWQKPGYVPEA
ncbi:photosynthetic NDH subunit of subcomplex B 3, chloroplastic isoform X2 [Phoenix dactylifera]|uniref:Photosynthetic NDH subunit of subcomplex B 3, chloroplastic isoform X2 n=1 Tax=Phoenix dactylifera TaxID=42345 RepID=A0A8B8J9Y4_PHODC|nr:photosynthetic NDH subunit of subcomplex B 3, chloroplastic isoform X2 [Phoenix dactylifera]